MRMNATSRPTANKSSEYISGGNDLGCMQDFVNNQFGLLLMRAADRKYILLL